MATTRLLRTSKPLPHATSSSACSSSLSTKPVRCASKAGFNGDKRICGCRTSDQRKLKVPIKASVATSDGFLIATKPEVGPISDLASLLVNVTDAILKALRQFVERRPWKIIQMLTERVIIDCRFLTLFAVAGTLLGSVLCFLEGSFLILESYIQFFSKTDQGNVVHLIVEAIDIFLVGTAMLIFGVGLYAMFVGSRNMTEKAPLLPGSNLFGLFYLKRLPKWVELESVSQAKSKIGHAVMILLQVGVLEKFNSIPLVTGLDLVCFAGSVLISSASIFILSRLHLGSDTEKGPEDSF